MIKRSKKTIIFTLVFSVFFASLLCCCLTGVSYANSEDIKAENVENHCHSEASEATNSTDSKDCECEQITTILDIKGSDFLESKRSLVKSGNDLFSQSASFSKIVKETSILIKYSPPIVYKTVVPLYLEFSVLRI